jgi:hypothetical protein
MPAGKMKVARDTSQTGGYHCSLLQSPVSCSDTLDGCHLHSPTRDVCPAASISMLLDAFYDPRAGALDQRSLHLEPNLTHGRDESLGGVARVEIEVDKDVVRIANRAVDAISAHAGGLTPCRVSIERGAPAGVVADRVFDLNGHHGRTSGVGIGPVEITRCV